MRSKRYRLDEPLWIRIVVCEVDGRKPGNVTEKLLDVLKEEEVQIVARGESRSNDTPLTAWTSPFPVAKEVCRFCTESIVSLIRRYLLNFGSNASRRPSPKRLHASVIRQIIIAGKINL